MDIYRVTRTGPHYHKPNVRYGTKVRAAAIARQVREANESLKRTLERYPDLKREPTRILIEKVPVEGFIDVTSEFLEGK